MRWFFGRLVAATALILAVAERLAADGSAAGNVPIGSDAKAWRQELHLTSTRNHIERDYARFMNAHPLPLAARQAVVDILVHEQLQLAPAPPPDGVAPNAAAALDRWRSSRAAAEADLKKVLAPEVFDALVEFRRLLPWEELADLIGAACSEDGIPISPPMVDMLVLALKASDVAPIVSAHSLARDPTMLGRIQSRDAQAVLASAGFLTPKQLDVMRQTLVGRYTDRPASGQSSH